MEVKISKQSFIGILYNNITKLFGLVGEREAELVTWLEYLGNSVSIS